MQFYNVRLNTILSFVLSIEERKFDVLQEYDFK